MTRIKIIDSKEGHNEMTFNNVEEFREFLLDSLNWGNRVILLELPDVGTLTLGVGKPYSFVEFMGEDGEPPYLIGTSDTHNPPEQAYIEFDSGGTVTPIPGTKCLPYETMVKVASYFIENKELPAYIKWEKI